MIVALDNMEDDPRRGNGAAQLSQSDILARARNRFHAHLLMDRGVDGLVRETFHQACGWARWR